MHQIWNVRIRFARRPRESWESGITNTWPVDVAATRVIADVIRMRDIDESTITSIDAERVGEPIEI